MNSKILSVDQLSIAIQNNQQNLVLTENISFELYSGKTLALVGESGSGKSITALAMMGVLPFGGGTIANGHIHFENQDLTQINNSDWQKIRGTKIAMIFQEPSSALNPLLRIKTQMKECLSIHKVTQNQEQIILDSLKSVGLTDSVRVLNSYPHQLSGGMQQRVMIAMALLLNPQILIADEPTTALDVTIQKQILDLIATLKKERNLAVLFITHHLGIVSQYADDLIVMQKGKIVESGPVREVIDSPKHIYTQELLNAIAKF